MSDKLQADELRRENKRLRKELRQLTSANKQYLRWWDEFMTTPLAKSSSVERGKVIGQANQALDLATDSALRFGLGLDASGKKLKR